MKLPRLVHLLVSLFVSLFALSSVGWDCVGTDFNANGGAHKPIIVSSCSHGTLYCCTVSVQGPSPEAPCPIDTAVCVDVLPQALTFSKAKVQKQYPIPDGYTATSACQPAPPMGGCPETPTIQPNDLPTCVAMLSAMDAPPGSSPMCFPAAEYCTRDDECCTPPCYLNSCSGTPADMCIMTGDYCSFDADCCSQSCTLNACN